MAMDQAFTLDNFTNRFEFEVASGRKAAA